MTLADDYKKFADYFPEIIQNWRPVNGLSEELSQARLEHFKDYFQIGAETANAIDKIVTNWQQKNTDGFALIQAELGLFEHQEHFCDYLAYLCFLYADYSIDQYKGDNKKFYLIQSHWERLIDEVGAQNTNQDRHALKLELEVWHDLISILRGRGVANELLELFPKELEALINDIERGLEYFDGPFFRTQDKHEEVRVRLNRSTQEYFESLRRHGLKTITDI